MKTYILGNEMCGHLIFPFIKKLKYDKKLTQK